MKDIKGLVPGVVVSVLIGLVGQVGAHYFPTLGAALFSILVGIILGNTIFDKECFSLGTKFSESRLLEYSIVLTGLTMNIIDVSKVGFNGVLFIFIQMLCTITIVYLLGRLLKFTRQFTLLMCAGNAVCGSSAIAAVSGVIKPEAKDKGISITIVNLTGTVLMVTLPMVTLWLYNHDTLTTSAMIGGTLQSIGQCIGCATFVNHDVVEFATVFKIIRIVFIVLVTIAFSRMNTEETPGVFKKADADGNKVKFKVPWYIIGFFMCAIITTFNILPEFIGDASHTISSQFEIYALAAIGMRVKFKHLLAEGPKAMVFGLLIGLCQVCLATFWIAILF